MSNSFTFDNVSQLDQDVSTTLAAIREWKNSFIPINRLPLDVFSLVPTYLSSQRDRFCATFVCRHWRKTFLQHSVLWSQLTLRKGEAYVKTLLERAKGSALDISISHGDPAGAITALSPYAQQITSVDFPFSYWKDIQQFSQVGPLPLLHTLNIRVCDEFSVDPPDRMTPPSLPLFAHAVNVKTFALHTERLPFLSHFVFPNLTTFKLSATPVLALALQYHALELLDFLEASPRLQTVYIRLMAGMIRLHNLPYDRVVVLPNVDAFSLVVADAGAGYELATHILRPSVKRASFLHERPNDHTVPQVIFPPPPSWSVISRQYGTSPIEEVALEMQTNPDPIISCSLSFRSSGTTVLELGFNLLRAGDDHEDEDLIPYGDLCRSTFSQALRTIEHYPLLLNVKRLRIGYHCFVGDPDNSRYFANEFGRLLRSVGPLDLLSVYGCDPHFYLAPFLNLPEYINTEHPIVYPPIKELCVHHPAMLHHEEECISAIVGLAKSQHARGIPFERLELLMETLPAGIAERLTPWVGVVECDESPCVNPEDF